MYEGLNRLFQSMPRIKLIEFARVYSGISGLSTNIIMDYLRVLGASGKIYIDCRNYMYLNRQVSEKMISEREKTWSYFMQSGRNDD